MRVAELGVAVLGVKQTSHSVHTAVAAALIIPAASDER
jgi:hypothetical protein